jgi:hypothetical protein
VVLQAESLAVLHPVGFGELAGPTHLRPPAETIS